MYDAGTRVRALRLLAQGRSLNSVSKQTGVSRSAIRDWRDNGATPSPRGLCPRCATPPENPGKADAYAYLLGLYLGDGCISRLRRTHCLRIACADAWPGLIDECERAMRAVRPHNSVCRTQRQGCVLVSSYSTHWLCLFPQHGCGAKHDRHIALDEWQQEIVNDHPWKLLRGLMHSDGCRFTNWTTRRVGGVRKRYEYPRYFFTNKSADIAWICASTLDKVGVEWTMSRRGNGVHHISVARRASVALMDTHVGPKY